MALLNFPLVHTRPEGQAQPDGRRGTAYVNPRERGLIHDIVDPTQPAQQTDAVYPILLDLIAPQQAQTMRAPL